MVAMVVTTTMKASILIDMVSCSLERERGQGGGGEKKRTAPYTTCIPNRVNTIEHYGRRWQVAVGVWSTELRALAEAGHRVTDSH